MRSISSLVSTTPYIYKETPRSEYHQPRALRINTKLTLPQLGYKPSRATCTRTLCNIHDSRLFSAWRYLVQPLSKQDVGMRYSTLLLHGLYVSVLKKHARHTIDILYWSSTAVERTVSLLMSLKCADTTVYNVRYSIITTIIPPSHHLVDGETLYAAIARSPSLRLLMLVLVMQLLRTISLQADCGCPLR